MSAPGARTGPAFETGELGSGHAARTKLWAGVLLGGLLAAIGAWLVGESKALEATAAKVKYSMMGTPVIGETQETRHAAANLTASRVYGVYGALLGMALGVAGGVAAGRAGSTVAGGGIGLIAGGAAGAAAPFLVVPLYLRLSGDSKGELVPALLMHCGLWTLIGAAAGLALAVGVGGRARFARTHLGGTLSASVDVHISPTAARLARAALGGALGMVIGIVIYEVLGGILFPLAGTSEPIAVAALPRLLMFLLTALPVSVCALLGARPAASAKRAT